MEFVLKHSSITNLELHKLPEENALKLYIEEFYKTFPNLNLTKSIEFFADSRKAKDETYLNLLINIKKSSNLILRFHPRSIEDVVLNVCR